MPAGAAMVTSRIRGRRAIDNLERAEFTAPMRATGRSLDVYG